MAQDPTPQRESHGYCITLTCTGDFTDAQEDEIVQWHRRKTVNCLLVREYHKDGTRHYHSTVRMMSPKTAGGVTRQLKTLYASMGIEFGFKSAAVKKTTDEIGFFHYCLKDVTDKPLLVTGWLLSWIKEQCKANVMKMPHKEVMKGKRQLNNSNAVDLCLEYALAIGHKVTCLDSFIDLTDLMLDDGYRFTGIRMGQVYAQVKGVHGNKDAWRECVRIQCFGLG